MGLFIVYSIGIIIGVALTALSSFYKELGNQKRNIFVAAVGVIAIIGGLIIGGFEGMPISTIGIGILTVAILLFIFGKNTAIRNIVLAIAVLVPMAIFIYAGVDKFYGNDFTVAAKDKNLDSYLKEYYEDLQTKTETVGFKRFEPSEGEKTIVLSLGEEKQGNNIEIEGIEKQGDRTLINVKTFNNLSKEKNPTIIIVLDDIEKNVVIKDTDGTVYNEIK